jgi:hypothetical protein
VFSDLVGFMWASAVLAYVGFLARSIGSRRLVDWQLPTWDRNNRTRPNWELLVRKHWLQAIVLINRVVVLATTTPYYLMLAIMNQNGS